MPRRRLSRVPVEATDAPLDAIVTEAEIIRPMAAGRG
jgi:5-formyltetrahydrofolate cyclo-ligase